MTQEPTTRRRWLSAERPGRGIEFAYDEARHLAAYLHARTLAHDKAVLDAGCGEGFGTVLLADTARSVLGIDYADEAITSARATYVRPNLRFERFDVHDVSRVGMAFDLITNFQVIEHLPDPERLLTAIRSALAPGGMLMLTTPNRLTSVSENPVHLREYTAAEMRGLLAPLFSYVRLCSMMGNDKVRAFDRERGRQVRRILRLDPFGLRHRLPRRLVEFAFAQLAAVVRRRAVGVVQAGSRITPEDFAVVDESRPDALDLVAFCRA